jgi:hypothetical protein
MMRDDLMLFMRENFQEIKKDIREIRDKMDNYISSSSCKENREKIRNDIILKKKQLSLKKFSIIVTAIVTIAVAIIGIYLKK